MQRSYGAQARPGNIMNYCACPTTPDVEWIFAGIRIVHALRAALTACVFTSWSADPRQHRNPPFHAGRSSVNRGRTYTQPSMTRVYHLASPSPPCVYAKFPRKTFRDIAVNLSSTGHFALLKKEAPPEAGFRQFIFRLPSFFADSGALSFRFTSFFNVYK